MFRKDLRSFTSLYDFLSQLLDFEDTDIAKRAVFYRVLWEVTKQDERLVAQAKNNSEAQFMVSPDLKSSVLSAAFRNQADQGQMVDHLFSDERVQLEVVKLLGRALFQSVHSADRPA